jgi:uncharacterized protein YndB with AHSA1/START domain
MQDYNWSTFTKRIPIKAGKEAIYNAWTTQAGLESWFLREAYFTTQDGVARNYSEQVKAGDKYKWLWHGYDDSALEQNEILEVNGTDLLKFSFSGNCIVTVRIKEEAGETICELTQQMPMDDEKEQRYFYIECGKGWSLYLLNLKSILEGGLDLRNKNVTLQNVVNA